MISVQVEVGNVPEKIKLYPILGGVQWKGVLVIYLNPIQSTSEKFLIEHIFQCFPGTLHLYFEITPHQEKVEVWTQQGTNMAPSYTHKAKEEVLRKWIEASEVSFTELLQHLSPLRSYSYNEACS